MLSHADLVALVERHIAEARISPSAFGRAVANDPHLVRQLRQGRRPRMDTVERILAAVAPASDAGSAPASQTEAA